jgi:hypothetical protein|tara:strand:- start:372 stop:689 length:318 start_codon:yes stop_codon:yes gene_type:complete
VKQVEQAVRRLIVLLAMRLHIVFAPSKARGPKIVADLPDGVELSIFPRLYELRFILMPAAQAFVQFPGTPGRSRPRRLSSASLPCSACCLHQRQPQSASPAPFNA